MKNKFKIGDVVRASPPWACGGAVGKIINIIDTGNNVYYKILLRGDNRKWLCFYDEIVLCRGCKTIILK